MSDASVIAALQQELAKLKARQDEIDSAAAGSSGSTSKKKEVDDADTGPWVPHYWDLNPHARRPLFLTDKPQHFELDSDLTYDRLSQKQSGMRHEYRVSEIEALSMHNIRTELAHIAKPIIDRLTASRSKPASQDANNPAGQTEADTELDGLIFSFAAVVDTHEESYSLLNQRLDYIRLKAKFEVNPSGITVAERTLLIYLESKVYGPADGLHVLDSSTTLWVEECGKQATAALLIPSAKQNATNILGGGSRGRGGRPRPGRGRDGNKGGRGDKGAGKGGPDSHP
jgi:hypothetical protein